MAQLKGIDVSKWQGEIDWDVLADNTQFVLMRASHGDVPTLAVDIEYVRNIAGARRTQMRRGVYHFPGTRDPEVEADFFVRAAGRKDGETQMLDFEGAVLDVKDPVGWAKTWLDWVHAKTGNKPLIYMSLSTVTRFNWSPVVSAGYGLVVAAWGRGESDWPAVKYWPFAAVWQYTNNAPTPGCPAKQPDGDLFNGGSAAWAAYAANDKDPEPLPALPVPKPPSVGFKLYPVVKGDNLIRIAKKLHVKGGYPELVKLNDIKDPNLIYVGQVLKYPA